jgi:hypothetical protein
VPSPERTGYRSTRFALIVTVIALLALVITPTAIPAPSSPRVKGAIVVVAGNIDPHVLRQAGVTHVAVALTDDNLRDFATSSWDGFVQGGFHVARDTTEASIRATARDTASLVQSHGLKFLIEDTEAHKADLPDGVVKPERLQWTEWLFSELRSRLGPSFPLYNVTVGIDSSPAVVNHAALRRHNIVPIWEAYDGNGVTLGVGRTAAKAVGEGWSSPQIAIGDKSLDTDLPQSESQGLAGVWLWAPDNGPALGIAPRGRPHETAQLAAVRTPAQAGIIPVPNPCELPVVGNVCDAVSGAVTKVAAEAGEFVMRGVTAWVTNAAVWVTGKVGGLIEKTTSPDLTASWFEGQYGVMVGVAGALALLMLMLAIIQSVIRQDIDLLVRSAFGYLPMAFVLAGVAIAATGLLVAITDDISRAVVSGLGTEQSDNLLQSVGDAYKNALDEGSGIPLFGVFLGAIILAIGAFVLWLELIIRDAAIYVCVFFLPLTFVAMIWPATGRWARRLVELLIAIILAKFVIVAILSLASAAIANTTVATGEGNTFERMIAGAALLVLAAWSPFALLRLIPMMEGAAASVVGQRTAMSAAAGSAGVHSPAAYMRQAMDRSARPSSPRAYPTTGGTTYAHARATERTNSEPPPGESGTGARSGPPSNSGGGTVDPTTRRPSAPPTSYAQPRSSTTTEAPPTSPVPSPPPPAERPRPPEPPPPPPARRPRPPEPPPDRGPPLDRGDA